jgi:hypothetical protein
MLTKAIPTQQQQAYCCFFLKKGSRINAASLPAGDLLMIAFFPIDVFAGIRTSLKQLAVLILHLSPRNRLENSGTRHRFTGSVRFIRRSHPLTS